MGWSRGEDGEAAFQAFPVGGGTPVLVSGRIYWRWSPGANSLSIAHTPDGQSYIIPLPPGQALPAIPAGGFRSEEDMARLPGARKTDAQMAIPGPSPECSRSIAAPRNAICTGFQFLEASRCPRRFGINCDSVDCPTAESNGSMQARYGLSTDYLVEAKSERELEIT